MKRFFLMVMVASVFFTGLGAMLQQTTAKFKSDEKALAILAKARQAIGGDSSLTAVNNFVVTGKSTRTMHFDGTTEKTITGDMELALQFPDKMIKSVKVMHNDGNGEKAVNKTVDLMVVSDGADGNFEWKAGDGGEMKPGQAKTIIIKKDDGTAEIVKGSSTVEVEKVAKDLQAAISTSGGHQIVMNKMPGAPGEFPRTNELARTALSLLLTAPAGVEASYTYAGEENIDGAACHVINAQVAGSAMRLYIGNDSNLPVMVSYQAPKPMVFHFETRDSAGAPAGGEKDVKMFTHQMAAPEMAEFQVKFSDFRNVGGLMLPYKWTQTMGGQTDEVIDVTSYEINAANIGEKFKGDGETKIFVRKAQ